MLQEQSVVAKATKPCLQDPLYFEDGDYIIITGKGLPILSELGRVPSELVVGPHFRELKDFLRNSF